jgi:flagellar hook-associated protein 2
MSNAFGTPTESVGVDVAGSINGVGATGAGQTLTGIGTATGLALKITGGAIGDRGSVSFARGYAYELNRVAGTMLGTDSDVDSRISGIKSSIKDIGTRRDQLTQRLTETEKRLRAQYSALDSMMAKMQGTSASLTQQLASLPKIG